MSDTLLLIPAKMSITDERHLVLIFASNGEVSQCVLKLINFGQALRKLFTLSTSVENDVERCFFRYVIIGKLGLNQT